MDGKPEKPAKTEAEIEAEHEARFARVMLAREAIVRHAGPHRKGIGVAGAVTPCPVCGTSELRYHRAGNSHIRARCQSAGCVSWIE